MTPTRVDAPGVTSGGAVNDAVSGGIDETSVPERAFPPGPRPSLRLSRDPAVAAHELAEQLGGRTIAYRYAAALLKAAT